MSSSKVNWLLVLLVNALILEIALSLVFFQRHSSHFFATLHYIDVVKDRLYGVRIDQSSIGIWKEDPLYGYSHAASTTGKHSTNEFNVEYSIDLSGNRIMPKSPNPLRHAWLLGCSFTFGWGVEDQETFPYLLGEKFLPDWELINMSVSGWSTSHAYLRMTEELRRRNMPPDVIYYSMIPDHVSRNYLRKDWLTGLAKYNRGHPHFEVRDNDLVYLGVVTDPSLGVESSIARPTEIKLTQLFLKKMNELALEKGVEFVVILLPQKHGVAGASVDWPPSIIETLVQNNIMYYDLTEEKQSVEFFQYDVHPTPIGHISIARLVADQIQLQDSSLKRPQGKSD